MPVISYCMQYHGLYFAGNYALAEKVQVSSTVILQTLRCANIHQRNQKLFIKNANISYCSVTDYMLRQTCISGKKEKKEVSHTAISQTNSAIMQVSLIAILQTATNLHWRKRMKYLLLQYHRLVCISANMQVSLKPVLNWANVSSRTQLEVFGEASWFLIGPTFLRKPSWKYSSKLYSGSKNLRSTCSGNIRPIGRSLPLIG